MRQRCITGASWHWPRAVSGPARCGALQIACRAEPTRPAELDLGFGGASFVCKSSHTKCTVANNLTRDLSISFCRPEPHPDPPSALTDDDESGGSGLAQPLFHRSCAKGTARMRPTALAMQALEGTPKPRMSSWLVLGGAPT
eukprot:1138934-Rhodomonas_salina.1